jgi:Transposase, Mutator family
LIMPLSNGAGRVEPPYNWSELYLGANFGGAWTSGSLNIPGNNLYGAEAAVRDRVRGFIQAMIEGELDGTLERHRYGRRPKSSDGDARRIAASGHRHGHRSRSLLGTFGRIAIEVPRARLNGPDGTTTEWTSRVLRAYQRRTLAADRLIASTYLAGTNTRRVRRALNHNTRLMLIGLPPFSACGAGGELHDLPREVSQLAVDIAKIATRRHTKPTSPGAEGYLVGNPKAPASHGIWCIETRAVLEPAHSHTDSNSREPIVTSAGSGDLSSSSGRVE